VAAIAQDDAHLGVLPLDVDTIVVRRPGVVAARHLAVHHHAARRLVAPHLGEGLHPGATGAHRPAVAAEDARHHPVAQIHHPVAQNRGSPHLAVTLRLHDETRRPSGRSLSGDRRLLGRHLVVYLARPLVDETKMAYIAIGGEMIRCCWHKGTATVRQHLVAIALAFSRRGDRRSFARESGAHI